MFKHPIKSAATMRRKKSDKDLTSIDIDTNEVIEVIGTSINKAVYLIRKADGSEGTIPTTFVTEVFEGANETDNNHRKIQSDRELERESKKRHEEDLKKKKREEEQILEQLAKKKMTNEEDIKRFEEELTQQKTAQKIKK